MATRRTLGMFAVALFFAAAAAHAQPVRVEHFAATLSGPQIDLKFKRLRDAHEFPIDRALEWVFQFSGADARKVEELSVRLVRDGFRIASLNVTDGTAILRVARTEHLTPRALERRNGDLTRLAAISGARYDGADATR